MKGIVLAGGTGSRLYPLTVSVNKHLLPIYDKPMIFYPISVLLLAGIKEILIITTKKDKNLFHDLLGNGDHLGCNFTYEIQEKPNGIGEAFIIGEKFIGEDSVMLILGDNILYGSGLSTILTFNKENSAKIFPVMVSDPERFGVVEYSKDGEIISIEEKPKAPKSKFAIPGIYYYPNDVIAIAKKIKPSDRGEIEISSINSYYLKQNRLKATNLPRGITWLDTGTPESLADAIEFVKVIEKRTTKKIACLEEVAFLRGFISQKKANQASFRYGKGSYADYISKI
jgi:glucose-1-phosphate thymidylyltransferase